MDFDAGNKGQHEPAGAIQRRGLFRFGTLITAFTGASAISGLAANSAQAAEGDTYVPVAEKGAAFGVATLDLESKIPAGQLPDLFVGRPTASEVTYFVTPRGKDTNDGVTLMSAKATIGAAITAAGASRARIILGVGSFTLASDILYPRGTVFVGSGSSLTILTYTGTGTAFAPANPGIRTFNARFEGLTLQGPGKATATAGISLDSVTDAVLKDVVVRQFGTGIRIHSAVAGGAVYNCLDNVVATSCDTGFKIEARSSNATKLLGCRANACNIGLDITDSNNTNWIAGSLEANTTGVKVTATSNALSDQNVVAFARFEGNTTAWNVTSANVRDFQMLFPALFGPYTFADSGNRTTHWGNLYTASNKTASSTATAAGSWRYERVANGGAETPAMVVADPVTTSGTPVTLQLETGRPAGSFIRGKRGGSTYFDVRADGLISGGTSTTAARPTGRIRTGSQWFDTTLRKPIWYNGTAWVDANGKTV